MKIAIVVSYPKDNHGIRVIEQINSLGSHGILWDLSEYPSKSETSFSLLPNKRLRTVLRVEEKIYGKKDLAGIYWRRPNGAFPKAKNPGLKEYVRLENEVTIKSLPHFLPNLNWISDPEATRLACRKPVQLAVANAMGMQTPLTCISNSPMAISDFIEALGDKPLTIKPVGTAFMNISENGQMNSTKNRVVFTKITSKELILDNIKMVSNCPVIFQEAIIKDYDIRVTVVDNECFAASIHSEDSTDQDNLDWRSYDTTRIYRHHKLSQSVEDFCIKITQLLNLRFGCIDLGFSKKNGYTFFEINPQGQWLPSELILGYNISGTLAKALLY